MTLTAPASAWRSKLKPLVPVYAAAIALKERLLQNGWPRQRRLAHPVISIGSLSAGGAGKTPVVMLLAELLATHGYEVRILTRGYGRSGTAPERVVPDRDPNRDQGANPNGDPHRFGDEPLMMARRLPAASVWVGADRHRTGTLSERHDQPGAKVVYLLDDGFQHRKLARDIDIVLLTRHDLSDSLLPAGNLREPLKAMRRAHIVVLREEEGFAAGLSGPAATWFVRRSLRFPDNQASPPRVIAFCGLARPDGFFAMLSDAGIEVVAVSIFRDHHAYSDADIAALIDLAKAHAADGFVTTEKDAVKLTPAMRDRLGVVIVPELSVSLLDANAHIENLLKLITDAENVVA